MIAKVDKGKHFEILMEVFKAWLRIIYIQTTVKYLGYTINGNGIMADDRGLTAIRDLTVPDKSNTLSSLAKPFYEGQEICFCWEGVEVFGVA